MKEEIPFTRVDLFEMPDGGVRVFWFRDGWYCRNNRANPKCAPATNHINGDMSLESMVAWLENNGWSVRRWPGGARGWKEEMLPVRTAFEIKRMRNRFERHPPPELEGRIHALDFAFDC